MYNAIKKYYDVDWGAVGSGALSGAAAGSFIPGWGTAIGGLIGAGSALFGSIAQKKQAKQIAARNPYPTQTIPIELQQNLQEAGQRAQTGMPSEQYAESARNIQRNQTNAQRQAQDRRAGEGLIPFIQQGTNDAFLNLNATSANMRLQNQRDLYGIRGQVAQSRQSAFGWNQQNRFLQDYGYSMGLLGAGNANLFHGIDEFAATMPYLFSGAAPLFGRGGQQIPGARRTDVYNQTADMTPPQVGNSRFNIIPTASALGNY